jgi:hypothetical protein
MSENNPYTPPQAQSAPAKPSSLQALFKQMPMQIKLAVGLQWLSLFVAVLAFLMSPGGPDEDADVGAFVSMALGLIIAIFLTIKLYEGKNWARFVVLLLTIGMSLYVLVPSDGPSHTTLLQKIADVLIVLLDLATVVLIFRQPGARWFQRE